MIIGYRMSIYDNDSTMFLSSDPNWPRCPKCGYTTDFDYVSPLFKLNNHMYDISSTYDNKDIVSLKFKEFCDRNHYKRITFKKLPNDPAFFKIEVKNIVKFDTQKAKLKYGEYCAECHNYESITPGLPIFLKGVSTPLGDGFYATDIYFASGNEKGPIVIIGVETYEKMKKEKFRGIVFTKVEKT